MGLAVVVALGPAAAVETAHHLGMEGWAATAAVKEAMVAARGAAAPRSLQQPWCRHRARHRP